MNTLFSARKLTPEGVTKSNIVRETFDALLTNLETIIAAEETPDFKVRGIREISLMKTKLEEASFFAQKALSMQTKYGG